MALRNFFKFRENPGREATKPFLEHLEDPTKLLCDCKRVLKPNGRLFISLPNIANITIRTMLLMGRFEYTQQGILDRTHLRFFTRQSAKQLIEGSGYKILLEQAAVIPLERALGLPPTNILMQLCNRVLKVLTRLRPNLFAYQNVFVVAADNESTA